MGTRCYLSRGAALGKSRGHQLLSGRPAFEEKTARSVVSVSDAAPHSHAKDARVAWRETTLPSAGDDGEAASPSKIEARRRRLSVGSSTVTRILRAGRVVCCCEPDAGDRKCGQKWLNLKWFGKE
jgi:hypothetical protein